MHLALVGVRCNKVQDCCRLRLKKARMLLSPLIERGQSMPLRIAQPPLAMNKLNRS